MAMPTSRGFWDVSIHSPLKSCPLFEIRWKSRVPHSRRTWSALVLAVPGLGSVAPTTKQLGTRGPLLVLIPVCETEPPGPGTTAHGCPSASYTPVLITGHHPSAKHRVIPLDYLGNHQT